MNDEDYSNLAARWLVVVVWRNAVSNVDTALRRVELGGNGNLAAILQDLVV